MAWISRPGRTRERAEIETAYGHVYKLERPHYQIDVMGLMMPPLRTYSKQAPYQHGDTWISTFLEPRTVTITLHARGCTRDDYFYLRNEILEVLNPHLGPFTYRFYQPDGTVRELRGVTYDAGLDIVPNRGASPQVLSSVFRMIAHDPVWWDPTENINTEYPGAATGTSFVFPLNTGAGDETSFDGASGIAFGGGGGTVDIDFNKTYLGNWPSYPIIQILGPAEDPVLMNVTIDEKLDLTGYTVAAGEIITIDLRFGYKTITSTVNDNIIGYLSTDSDLATFRLEVDPVAVDGLNAFNFTAGATTGDTAVTIRWYSRYIGI